MSEPFNSAAEQLYLQYKKEATTAARWASRCFYRPAEETQDHADFALALLLLQHLDEHDPDRLSLSRWIRMRIHFHLREVYTRGHHPYVEDVREFGFREQASSPTFSRWERDLEAAPAAVEAPISTIQRMLREVGEEGAALLQIIRDLPSDLWEEIRPERGRSPKTKRHNLRSWLVDAQDWPPDRVERAFQEVEECL